MIKYMAATRTNPFKHVKTPNVSCKVLFDIRFVIFSVERAENCLDLILPHKFTAFDTPESFSNYSQKSFFTP